MDDYPGTKIFVYITGPENRCITEIPKVITKVDTMNNPNTVSSLVISHIYQ